MGQMTVAHETKPMDGWRQVIHEGGEVKVIEVEAWEVRGTKTFPVVPEGATVMRLVPPLCMTSDEQLVAEAVSTPPRSCA